MQPSEGMEEEKIINFCLSHHAPTSSSRLKGVYGSVKDISGSVKGISGLWFLRCSTQEAAQDCPHPALSGNLGACRAKGRHQRAAAAAPAWQGEPGIKPAWQGPSQPRFPTGKCTLQFNGDGFSLPCGSSPALGPVLAVSCGVLKEKGHEEESYQHQLLQQPTQETELQKFSWEVIFLGCFKQFTQEFPSLMGFVSRTDIKILVSFPRKRHKKSPGIPAE